jgi:hypothetical protein
MQGLHNAKGPSGELGPLPYAARKQRGLAVYSSKFSQGRGLVQGLLAHLALLFPNPEVAL